MQYTYQQVSVPLWTYAVHIPVDSTHTTWGIRTNEELRELYKDLDIVADIKRSDWNGLDM